MCEGLRTRSGSEVGVLMKVGSCGVVRSGGVMKGRLAVWISLVAVVGLVEVATGYHYMGCPVLARRIRRCERSDAYYSRARCALPKLADVVDYEEACEEVYNFIRYSTPCNLNPVAHDLTAIVMRKGCQTESGHFVLLSTTLKAMLNVVERRCRRTNRIFDEKNQEPGYFDSTLHPNCTDDIIDNHLLTEPTAVVRTKLVRRAPPAPASTNIAPAERLGRDNKDKNSPSMCRTAPCKSSCQKTCAEEIDGNTYCCPFGCLNVTPIFIKVCCLWQSSLVACTCTNVGHLTAGFC